MVVVDVVADSAEGDDIANMVVVDVVADPAKGDDIANMVVVCVVADPAEGDDISNMVVVDIVADPAEGDANRPTRHLHGPHGGGEEDGQGRLPQQCSDTRNVVRSAAGGPPGQPYVSRPHLVTLVSFAME